jgi:O-antigen/teichoic acid export membrane protein
VKRDDSSIKLLLLNNSLLIVQFAAGGLIPLVLIPHFIRTMGLSAYGEIAIGLSFANYASIVVQYAFNLTGPKYLAELHDNQSRKTVFLNVTFSKFILFLAVFLPSLFLVLFVLPEQVETSVFLVYCFLPVGAVFHSGWYLQSINRFAVVTVVSIFSTIIPLIVGFYFVVAPGDDFVALCSLTIGSILSGLGTFMASSYMLKLEPYKIDRQASFEYLRDGRTIFFSQFVASMYTLSGPVVIGQFINSSAAGAYSAVERIIGSVSSVCQLTHTAAYPRLARLYPSDRFSYRRLLKVVVFVYLLGANFFFFVVLATGESFGQFVLGEGAEVYGNLITWGVLLVFMGILGPVITGYYVVSGQQKKVYPLTVKILFISMGLGIPGVIYFGAWAWFCSLAIAQGLVLFWAGMEILRK